MIPRILSFIQTLAVAVAARWYVVTSQTSPKPRYVAPAGAHGTDIYVFGGLAVDEERTGVSQTSRIYRYSTVNKTWTHMQFMPASVAASGTTASDAAGTTIINRKQIAQATVKPVMGLRAFYSKDKEFDFSNAFLVADYDTAAEFVPTILNNGVTYDCLAHTLFARA